MSTTAVATLPRERAGEVVFEEVAKEEEVLGEGEEVEANGTEAEVLVGEGEEGEAPNLDGLPVEQG